MKVGGGGVITDALEIQTITGEYLEKLYSKNIEKKYIEETDLFLDIDY